MRELLFRAWDSEYERWEYLPETGNIDLWTDDPVIFSFDFSSEIFTIEQYTGLKDKNGKRIYEGDILKWIKHDGKKYHNQVYYCAGSQSCGFKVKGGHWHDNLTGNRIYNAKAEIIGNIHENPELLNN